MKILINCAKTTLALSLFYIREGPERDCSLIVRPVDIGRVNESRDLVGLFLLRCVSFAVGHRAGYIQTALGN